MSKTIGRFTYRVTKMKKGDDSPFDSYVEITLDHYGKNNDGVPMISPTLVTENEIDLHIQLLKSDLDSVGKRAKAAILRAKEETMSIVRAQIPN